MNVTLKAFENGIIFNVLNVFNKFQANQTYLKNVTVIMIKIHDKLASSYKRSIYQQDVPVLLYKETASLTDLKFNIDKYLQFALSKEKNLNNRCKLMAMQLISDYCCGLEISELQLDKAYNGLNFDMVADEITYLLSAYDCTGTPLGKLVSDAHSMKGTSNLDGVL